jgi:tetratricopeptide (TPR) repeat protein
MAEALATYEAQYPDRPLWQQAFAAGRRAQTLAPDALEPLRFLAEAYSRSQWTGPAWRTWQDFLTRGGDLDDEGRALAADVGKRLAYGFYEAANTDAALGPVRRGHRDRPRGRRGPRVGRPDPRRDRAAGASDPVLARALELDPSDARAAYFLELAQEQAVWGIRGRGRLPRRRRPLRGGAPSSEAAERFARATTLNPAYVDAWAWLGRVAFEQGQYGDAATYYGTAAGSSPTTNLAYWVEESQRRAARNRPRPTKTPRAPERTPKTDLPNPGTTAE